MFKPLPRGLAALSPLNAGLAIVTWRDINRLDKASIRGPKRFWRLVGTNPAGAIAYWVVGRKRAVLSQRDRGADRSTRQAS